MKSKATLYESGSYLIGIGLDVIKKYPKLGHFTFILDQYPKLKFFFLKTKKGYSHPNEELFHPAFKKYEEIVKALYPISLTGSEISEEDARKAAFDMTEVGSFLSKKDQLMCIVGLYDSSESIN